MPGIFISIFPGDAAGEAAGIGMFISNFCGGEACGFGEAVGICMPGIFVFICMGADRGVADCLGDDDGCAGMFIPGMLPISFLFAGVFCAGVFLPLDAAFRRWVAGIFIPGMSIPGMLLMSCFLVSRLFRATLLFFGAAFRVAVDLDFGIFIPGMFCMSLP
jgi:hypothetical protein